MSDILPPQPPAFRVTNLVSASERFKRSNYDECHLIEVRQTHDKEIVHGFKGLRGLDLIVRCMILDEQTSASSADQKNPQICEPTGKKSVPSSNEAAAHVDEKVIEDATKW